MGKRINTAKWDEKQKRWKINVQKDGERKSFYSSVSGRTGQREANAKADMWLDEGILSSRQKISQLYEQFQTDTEIVVKTSMRRQIESFGKVWIIPNIGKKKISSLCDQDIQHILDKAAAAGRSKKTIQDLNATINMFLKYCRRLKISTFRPEEVKIPASARLKGKRVLQPGDLIKLLNIDTTILNGKKTKEPYINAYRFEVLTGMRPGEIRGLRRDDVQGKKVMIRRAINSYGEITQGKNENAIRSFVLSSLAEEVLLQQLSEYDGEFIFNMPSQTVYQKHWKRYCEVNEISRISPYELRHTFVSVVKTLPEGEVKPIVGHSQNMDTFGVYGHAIDGEDGDVAEKVNALFEKVIATK